MTEIRFRAWDGYDKLMYYNIQNGIHFDDGSCYDFGSFIKKTRIDYHDWIIEQFTGLLDKNGNEIYEGDICDVIFHDGDKEKMFVIWSEEKYGFHFSDGCGGFWANTSTPIEVIGNIHENADLLKGEK